jgi:hypothetical protein
MSSGGGDGRRPGPAGLRRSGDVLPAGLEPIGPDLKTTDPGLRARLDAGRVAANRPEAIACYGRGKTGRTRTKRLNSGARDPRLPVSV